VLSVFWPEAEHEKLIARWPLRDRRVKDPSAEDLRAYRDMRTQPAMLNWPPARTAPCWCGSMSCSLLGQIFES
jgi:hypothetical protein